MQISWHGQYTIKIASKEATVILDPHSGVTGLPAFRAKADIVALTNPSDEAMSGLSGISGAQIIVKTPGEYSFGAITLHAFSWFENGGAERSIMRWNIEGVTILHVGALTRKPTEEELTKINQTDIDILLIPVGGGTGLGTADALELVSTIEPRIVIPIHFKLPKLKEKLESVDQFAKEMGVSTKSAEKKIIVRANRLPHDDMETIILKP